MRQGHKIVLGIVVGILAIILPVRSLLAGVTFSYANPPSLGSQSASMTIKAAFSGTTFTYSAKIYITNGVTDLGQKNVIASSDEVAFSTGTLTQTVSFSGLTPETTYEVWVNNPLGSSSIKLPSITTLPWDQENCTNAGFMCIWQNQDTTYTTASNGKVEASISLSSVNIPEGSKIWVVFKDTQSSTLSGGQLFTVVAGGKLTFNGSSSIPLSDTTPQHVYHITTETRSLQTSSVPGVPDIEIIHPIFSQIPDIIVPTTLPVTLVTDKTPEYCKAHPEEYCLLEPIPQFGASVDTSDLQGYFTKIISLILMLGSAFAVLMIVYGGVLYMGSESVFKKGEGLAKVEGAILGLLLLIGSYAILNSINPDLVNLKIRLRPVAYNISYEEASKEASVNTDGTYNYTSCPNKIKPKTDEGCPTCRLLSGITVVSTGKQTTDTLADKLETFNQSEGAANWRVTEAYAPAPIHCAQCHYNGTCIDAGLNDKTVANIKSFYDKALAAGLGPVYEVSPSQTTLYNQLKDAGVNVIHPSWITAEHFSVYCKPGVTNGC